MCPSEKSQFNSHRYNIYDLEILIRDMVHVFSPEINTQKQAPQI